MFQASMCPSSGENCCIYATLYGWCLQVPPIQSDKYQCHIDTAIFSWWWAHDCLNMKRREINKYINQNCAPSWICLWDYEIQNLIYRQHRDKLDYIIRLVPFGWRNHVLLQVEPNIRVNMLCCILDWLYASITPEFVHPIKLKDKHNIKMLKSEVKNSKHASVGVLIKFFKNLFLWLSCRPFSSWCPFIAYTNPLEWRSPYYIQHHAVISKFSFCSVNKYVFALVSNITSASCRS